MRTIFSVLAAIVVWAPSVRAQVVPSEIGFVRMVNAVAPGEGNTNVLIDGKDGFAEGYRLGQLTGAVGLKAGSHSIAFKKAGVGSGATKVSLEAGETWSLIGFAERVPAGAKDEPPVWAMKILRLKQSDPERGYRLTLVSVCEEDEVKVTAVTGDGGAGKVAHVKRMKTALLDLGKSRREAILKVGNTKITTISPDRPGNYVVVIYQNAEGKFRALSFYDPKYVIAQ